MHKIACLAENYLTDVSCVDIINTDKDGLSWTERQRGGQFNEINWYYILYLFGSMSAILGLINLWIYRKQLWVMLFGKNDED